MSYSIEADFAARFVAISTNNIRGEWELDYIEGTYPNYTHENRQWITVGKF